MSLAQPNASAWNQTYGYDTARRLKHITSPAGFFDYDYDDTAQLLVKKLTQPSGAYITNTFDGNARLMATVLKNSGNTNLNSHSYLYNVGNQRTNQTFTDGNYVRYDYDPIGQLTNAVGKESGGATNRLQEQLAYEYDDAHNLASRTNNGLVQSFGVNSLNELTTITRTGTFTVAGTSTSSATGVTVNGNSATLYSDRTFAKSGVSLTNGNNTFTAIASDALGRSDTNAVTAYLPQTNSFAYDLNGNMTSDGKRGFDYDDENQLIRITTTNAWKSEFTYDGRMRCRIEKNFAWTGFTWVLSNETRFIYDGNVPIQHRDANNVPTQTLTRGTDLSGTLQGAGGIGGILALTEDQAIAPEHSFFHGDGNGNVTMLINENQGIAAKYLFDPFGNTLSISGSKASANLYRFSSKPVHELSGTYDFLYRRYMPEFQRWLNRDPIEELGSPNLYTYVGNSPGNAVDSHGLWQISLFGGRGWGVYFGFGKNSGKWNITFGVGAGFGFSGSLDVSDSGKQTSSFVSSFPCIAGGVGEGVYGIGGEFNNNVNGSFQGLGLSAGGRLGPFAAGYGGGLLIPGNMTMTPYGGWNGGRTTAGGSLFIGYKGSYVW